MTHEIPLLRLGRRLVPAFCPLTRVEGDLSLSAHPTWPGLETCESCVWFYPGTVSTRHPNSPSSLPPAPDTPSETPRSSTAPPAPPAAVSCTCPGVEQRGTGLSAEIDVYRTDGRKRRSFLDLSQLWNSPAPEERLDPAQTAQRARAFKAAIKAELTFPNAAPVERVDLKFVEGAPSTLIRHPDAWQERWRYYWNGERWVRKPPGASLHDWNKWGRRLEHLSASSPGGLPPPDGWPPVLDLPPGRYRLRVLDLRWRTGRRGEPELEWIFRVIRGPYRGKRIFHRAPVRSPAHRLRFEQDLLLIAGPVEPTPEGVPFSLESYLQKIKRKAVDARVCVTSGFVRLYINNLAGVKTQTATTLTNNRQSQHATNQQSETTKG